MNWPGCCICVCSCCCCCCSHARSATIHSHRHHPRRRRIPTSTTLETWTSTHCLSPTSSSLDCNQALKACSISPPKHLLLHDTDVQGTDMSHNFSIVITQQDPDKFKVYHRFRRYWQLFMHAPSPILPIFPSNNITTGRLVGNDTFCSIRLYHAFNMYSFVNKLIYLRRC